MALSFPATFPDTIFQEQTFKLHLSQEMAKNARGQVFVKDFGSGLWLAEVKTKPLRNDYAMEVEAKLNSLDGGINTFMFGDLRRKFPKEYPLGYDDTNVAVYALNVNNKALRLDGLASGPVLTVGDEISFTYGPSSARAYHQVMETVTADGSGITPEFEVRPHLRAGIAINDAVKMINPRAEMMIEPQSLQSQMQGQLHTVLSWRGIQVIRV